MANEPLGALEELKPQIVQILLEALDVSKKNMDIIKEAMVNEMLKYADAQKEDIKKLKDAIDKEHVKNEEKIREIEKQTEKILNDMWKDGEERIEKVCTSLEALIGKEKLQEYKDNTKQYLLSTFKEVLNNLHEMTRDCSKDLDDIFNRSVGKVNRTSFSD